MSENYIVINGKRAELTEEQLKQLGIEVPKTNPFERVCSHANEFYSYYYISSSGNVCESVDSGYCNGNGTIDMRHKVANYCTDKSLMEQRALHETLNRLLWRYAMEHGGHGNSTVAYNPERDRFLIQGAHYKYLEPSFKTCKTAEAAIKEIVEPFMAEHPEFKW